MRGKKTKLRVPEVGLGLLPGAGSVVGLVLMVGLKKALPYSMQGTRSDADTALEEGWVDAAAIRMKRCLLLRDSPLPSVLSRRSRGIRSASHCLAQSLT